MKKQTFVFLVLGILILSLTACSRPITYEEAIENNIGQTEVTIGNKNFRVVPEILYLSCPNDLTEWQTAESVKLEAQDITIGFFKNNTEVIRNNTIRGMETNEPVIEQTIAEEGIIKVYSLIDPSPKIDGLEIKIGLCAGTYIYQQTD